MYGGDEKYMVLVGKPGGRPVVLPRRRGDHNINEMDLKGVR